MEHGALKDQTVKQRAQEVALSLFPLANEAKRREIAYGAILELLRENPTWESMESAPKDGYLWLFGTVKTFDGYERENAMVIGRWNEVVKEWRVSDLGGPREVVIEPQLWQRMPDRPFTEIPR